jgi:hypothetical protein
MISSGGSSGAHRYYPTAITLEKLAISLGFLGTFLTKVIVEVIWTLQEDPAGFEVGRRFFKIILDLHIIL